jgi:hypothetical protein
MVKGASRSAEDTMMHGLEIAWASIQVLAAIVMWLSIVLFVAKSLWNLGVPYAMVHEALKHPEDKHGWSLFILLDLGLFVIGALTSVLAGSYAPINVSTMLICGVGVILGCYVHLIAVMFIGGYVFGLFPKNGQRTDPPPQ